MKLLVLSCMLLCLATGCKDDSTNPDNGAWKTLNGIWKVTISGYERSIDVTSTSNSVTWDGLKFSGSWSGNTFNRTYSFSQSGASTNNELLLSVVSSTKISGNIKTTVTFGGMSNSNTENFTGTKE